MIGRETRVLLRHYLEQGMSKAAIAQPVLGHRLPVANGEHQRAAAAEPSRFLEDLHRAAT